MSLKLHKIVNYLIAFIWLANGLFCKVLNLVPRHQEIVAKILGSNHSRVFTLAIGLSEIVMAIWILSGYKRRINVYTQILVIAIMNTLEFFLVPDSLLWGRFNSLFALLLIVIIYFNEFYLNKKQPNY